MSREAQDPIVINDIAAYFGTTVSQQDIESLGASRIEFPQDEAARAGEGDVHGDVAEFLGKE
jgi:hypothetical protein